MCSRYSRSLFVSLLTGWNILALLLLAFTMRRLLEKPISHSYSAHQFVCPRLIHIRARKSIMLRWLWLDGLISALIATSSPRLKAWCGDDAVCIYIVDASVELSIWQNKNHLLRCYNDVDNPYQPFIFPLNQGICEMNIDPYHAMLIYLNFHSLEVVSRYRDPQLQLVENSYLFNWSTNICTSLCLDTKFIPNNSDFVWSTD